MITLILNNNKFKITGPLKIITKIRNDKLFHRKSAAWFWAMRSGSDWDGYINDITDAGYASTGHFGKIVNWFKANDIKFRVDDLRPKSSITPNEVALGGEFDFRDYQWDAIKAVAKNKVAGVLFPRGIIGAGVNAGKTIIMAGIHKAYSGKTLVLVKSKDLFQQLLEELPEYTGETLGQISTEKEDWDSDLVVAMAPTIKSRLAKYQSKLARFDKVLVDECDEATSKTYEKVLQSLFNSTVRIGLSGSAFDKKDVNDNEKLRAFFGDLIYEKPASELRAEKISADIYVKVVKGNEQIKLPGDYQDEYTYGIVKNLDRNRKAMYRVKRRIRRNHYPMIVFAQKKEHIQKLYRMVCKLRLVKELDLKVDWVNSDKDPKERRQLIKDFRDGKVHILIGSMVLKRGMNFPLLVYGLNAGGGDSISNIKQILGRLSRRTETKTKTYFEDFYDIGAYLMRHSKHRIQLYKKEGLKIHELYKEK